MSNSILVIGFRPSFSDSHTGKVYLEYEDHQDHPSTKTVPYRDHREEPLAEIGRSYNVSGWTIARLSKGEI